MSTAARFGAAGKSLFRLQRRLRKTGPGYASVFAVCWCALFLLYLPAASCGWVSDTLGWLDAVRNQSFPEYINRSRFGVRSFYQTTQFITWCFYRLFGASHWAWHIIHLSLHALNCTLLYALCRRLIGDAGIARASGIAAAIALLFCTSPYASEVIVWEAAFHYLQGLCFMLCILNLLYGFMRKPQPVTAAAAGLLFLVSAFSLELFYLTPLFTALLIFHHHAALRPGKAVIRRAIACFLVPQLALFVLHLVLVRLIYGASTARLGDALLQMPLSYYAIRPPDYWFHLFGGRFLPQGWRSAVHQAFCTYAGAGLFYAALLGVMVRIVTGYSRMGQRARLTALLFACLMSAMALVSPMWFPERLLILGDRYLYIMLPFFFAAAAMLATRINSPIPQRVLLLSALALQCAGTLYLSRLWQASQAITDTLQDRFIPYTGKTVLLLNNPQSLRGAPMIGAGADGELKLMHNLLYGPPVTGNVTDVLAAELGSAMDSTGIYRWNDSTIYVKLLRPGARWWYGSDYARDYETADFKVRLQADESGHYGYVLSLKGGPDRFLLLYQEGGKWKSADRQGL